MPGLDDLAGAATQRLYPDLPVGVQGVGRAVARRTARPAPEDREAWAVPTAQNRTGLSIRRLVRTLRRLRSATIAINGAEQTFPPQIPAEIEPVIAALRNRPVTH